MAGKKGRSGGARKGAGRKPLAVPNKNSHKKYPRVVKPGCSVYVIHESLNLMACKIGVTTDIAARFSAMQVCTWRELTLAYSVRLETVDDAMKIESVAHAEFMDKRLRGEWFEITPEDAIAAIKRLIAASKNQCLGSEYEKKHQLEIF